MLLCVNVGNSMTRLGLFEGRALTATEAIPATGTESLPSVLGEAPIEAVAVASVAPSRTEAVCEVLATATGVRPRVAGVDLPVPLEVRVAEPEEVGVDRLLDALAAYGRTGCQTVVIDAGTAVTVDLVSAAGAFCGGAIAPGPGLLVRALHEGTEKLPRIEFQEPHLVVGRDTEEAMASGAFWGAVGMVAELVRRMTAELIGETRVVGTGGYMGVLAPHLPMIETVVPELALEGLAICATEAE